MISRTEAVRRLQAKGRKDPVQFIRTVWPRYKLEEWQIRTIQEVLGEEDLDVQRVAAATCNGAGKTWLMGLIAVTFMLIYPPAIVVTTSGSWEQVKRQVWKEIRGHFLHLPDCLQFPEIHTTDWNVAEKWYAVGMSTNNPKLFEGHHGPHVLVLIDEAKAVEDGIFQATDRIFARRGRKKIAFQASSPGDRSGEHFRAFHEAADLWTRIHVNPFDGSIIRPGEDPEKLPPTDAISPEFIERAKKNYGEDSPLYISMILGRWPKESEHTLFPYYVLDACRQPPPADAVDRGLVCGVDVARSLDADECVVYVLRRLWLPDRAVQAYSVVEFDAFHTRDDSILEDRVKDIGVRLGINPRDIRIDAHGLGGPVADHLRREGWAVRDFLAGGSAITEIPPLANARADMWWRGANIVRTGRLFNLQDDRTRAQLNAPKYSTNAKDQIVIETKEHMAKRLRREQPGLSWSSPDRADGLLQAIYEPPLVEAPPLDPAVV